MSAFKVDIGAIGDGQSMKGMGGKQEKEKYQSEASKQSRTTELIPANLSKVTLDDFDRKPLQTSYLRPFTYY